MTGTVPDVDVAVLRLDVRGRPASGVAPSGRSNVRPEGSGARDLARLDAGSADVQPLGGPAHDRAHGLDVGVPPTARASVGVGDRHTEARPLAADVTHRRHEKHSVEVVAEVEVVLVPVGVPGTSGDSEPGSYATRNPQPATPTAPPGDARSDDPLEVTPPSVAQMMRREPVGLGTVGGPVHYR